MTQLSPGLCLCSCINLVHPSLWPGPVYWIRLCLLILYCAAQLLLTLACLLTLSPVTQLSLVAACIWALQPSPALVPNCFSILFLGLQPPASSTADFTSQLLWHSCYFVLSRSVSTFRSVRQEVQERPPQHSSHQQVCDTMCGFLWSPTERQTAKST